jgi:hypothetical protein
MVFSLLPLLPPLLLRPATRAPPPSWCPCPERWSSLPRRPLDSQSLQLAAPLQPWPTRHRSRGPSSRRTSMTTPPTDPALVQWRRAHTPTPAAPSGAPPDDEEKRRGGEFADHGARRPPPLFHALLVLSTPPLLPASMEERKRSSPVAAVRRRCSGRRRRATPLSPVPAGLKLYPPADGLCLRRPLSLPRRPDLSAPPCCLRAPMRGLGWLG